MENQAHVVLVVEDELLVRLNAIDTIESSGFDVLAAGNADEALEILKRRSDVEVIFTDINMPGSMDGLDLVAFVRSKWPRIALIVTSGRLPPTLQEKMPEGGKFFSKPYDLSALVQAIETATVGNRA